MPFLIWNWNYMVLSELAIGVFLWQVVCSIIIL